MPAEREAVIWCKECRVEKFEVWRVPTETEGVYVHDARPADKKAKHCECGAVLERK